MTPRNALFIATFMLVTSLSVACGGPDASTPAEMPSPVILYDEDMAPRDMRDQRSPGEDMGSALLDMTPDSAPELDMGVGDDDMPSSLDMADMADMPDMPGADEVDVRVIARGSEVVDDRTHPYTLLAITHARTGQVTYAQWFEPHGGHIEGGPVMVLTRPYAGIDWTGEEVDERWASLGNGSHPDVDSPGASNTPENIAYSKVDPREGVDNAMIYLLNGISTLHVFGRFYAGGSIEDDIEDMANGMRYLATREDIDKENIGVFGGSWGGFEAFYAAMHAPASVTPEVGVAFYPLTDFEQEVRYVESFSQVQSAPQREMYQYFFAPYLRRIYATTGGPPDSAGANYASVTHAEVDARLRTPFFVFHDDQDTLVPFSMSQDLVQNELVSYTWFLHPTPVSLETAGPSHGETIARHWLSISTISTILLMSRLKDDGGALITLADSVAFEAMLSDLHAQRERGQTLGNFPSMLADLANVRVQIFDIQTNTVVEGAEFVSERVNAAWGTSYSPTNIEAALRAL